MSIAVGFDIGGSTLRAGLIRFDGPGYQVLSQQTRLLEPADKPPERMVSIIAETVSDLIRQGRVEADEVQSVGFGLCGQLTDNGRTMVNSPHLDWHQVAIGRMLDEALPWTKVAIDNDLNAILWGEHLFGRARGCRHVVAMFVGSGIGGASMVDGRLVRGASGFAGEIGHVKLGGGFPCRCGDSGCTETLAGGTYVEARVATQREAGLLDETVYGHLARVRPGDLDLAYLHGERTAEELWHEVSRSLSSLIACCVALIDPEMVLLGGGVLERTPALVSLLASSIRERIPGCLKPTLRVELAELGIQAGVLGAASLALA